MQYYDIHTHRQTDNKQIITIQNKYPEEVIDTDRYYSIGTHPWYIHDPEKQLSLLIEKAAMPNVVAIGEAGLDKLTSAPLSIQQEIFEAQALLAEKIQKPLIIHCVKAWDELIAIKKRISPETPWIIHGFRGNNTLSRQLINQGFYLSFSDRFHADALHWNIINRIFLETDDSITPLLDIYKSVSSHLNIETELLAEKIRVNVQTVFSI